MLPLTPEVQDWIDRLSRLAKDARAAADMTVAEVAAATHNDRSVLTRINSGKWVEEGLSKDALQATFQAMHASDAVLSEAVAIYEAVVTWKREVRAPGSRASALRMVRWGCAPVQLPSRAYATIDKVSLDILPDGRVDGTIERLEPESRRGAAWHCSGYVTNQTLHVTFWPVPEADLSKPQSDSIGQFAVSRQPSSKLPWPGFYTKLERREGTNPELSRFQYWLSPSTDPRLIHAASTVGVIDFDNTLARGWILGPWMVVLAEQGIGGASEGVTKLEELFARYARSEAFGHDKLANEAAEVYAKALAGVKVAEVEKHAQSFVADYVAQRGGRLFRSTLPLLSGLKQRGIRPILVTGAPSEVVARLMRELDVNESFALQLEVDGDRYTGDIRFNHGLASGKDQACQELEDRECTISVAVGDSDGDRAMWRRAACSVRVGGRGDATPVSVEGLDMDAPLEDSFWAVIPRASWLDEVRETATAPPGIYEDPLGSGSH